MKNKKITKITEDYIIELIQLGMDDGAVGAMLAMSKNDEVRERAVRYMRYKGRYLPQSDAIAIIRCLCGVLYGEREKYMPYFKHVRYVGKSTRELTDGKLYHVQEVLDYRENAYLINNDKNRSKEYPSAMFIPVRPSRITYIGVPEGEKPFPEEQGLTVGAEYSVVSATDSRYTLADGKTVWAINTECLEFVDDDEPKPPTPLEHNFALRAVRGMFEFCSLSRAYKYMARDAVYSSDVVDVEICGREKICEYIVKKFQSRFEDNIYADVALATVRDGEYMNAFEEGERVLMIFDSDGFISAASVKTDGYYITEIRVTEYYPPYSCDEKK